MSTQAPQVVVYRARNLVNGKTYVGVTKTGLAKRERHHRRLARSGGGYRLHAALRKYGDENIVFEPVMDFEDDLPLAFVFEAELIDAEKPAYNTSQGGWLSTEALNKLLAGKLHKRTRRKMTDEEKARRKELMRRYPPPRLGSTMSEEHKAKLIAGRVGKPAPWQGKKRPELVLKAGKPVMCVEDGLHFPSVAHAERHYGLKKDAVGRVVRGERLSVDGRHFVRTGAK